MKRDRGVLIVTGVILLAGLGLSFGAYSSWSDQHSGVPGKARVAFCSGHNGRNDTGVSCRGTWVTGAGVLHGGEAVFGPITGADAGDVGHVVDVRVHGSDHATVPALRVSIILALIGAAMLVFGLVLARAWWRGPQAPRASESPGTSP